MEEEKKKERRTIVRFFFLLSSSFFVWFSIWYVIRWSGDRGQSRVCRLRHSMKKLEFALGFFGCKQYEDILSNGLENSQSYPPIFQSAQSCHCILKFRILRTTMAKRDFSMPTFKLYQKWNLEFLGTAHAFILWGMFV